MTTHRHSKQRDAIYDVLCSTKAHPSAEWVYAQLKGANPELSLATVYRNMRLFVDEGRAIMVQNVGGIDRFDGNANPHTHFVCDVCEAVIDIEHMQSADAFSAEVAKNTGAHVTGVVLHGTCAQCKDMITEKSVSI